MRRTARVLGGAALAVTLGVLVNQILNNGVLSFTWLYLAFGVAVLSFLYSEAFAAPAPATPGPRGGRRVYLRQLRASVRDMETVGIATQSEYVLRMRQVYVELGLVPKPTHAAAREPYLGTLGARTGERRTLESFLADGAGRVFAVIGGPGSGKTTLVRNTALDLCGPLWRRGPLPVLLYLRDHAAAVLADEPVDLATAATSAGWLAERVPDTWLRRRLERGDCVVLLDGLDEVADERDRARVVTWVQRQIQRHPGNTWVLTSRPHGYRANPLPNAEVLQVLRFTGDQISRFLHSWYHAIERRATGEDGPGVATAAARKADDLLARLRARPALYDLAANPLLLTMIANVHRYRDALPGSRAALYAEMCDVLLHRRQEARNLTDPTGLRGPQKERVMRHLALAMMRAKARDMRVDDACRAIRLPLRQVSRDVDPLTFLEVARRSGLLVEREQGLYAFAHLTLQEYLAAARIGREHVELLTANVDDPWWRETTLLWAADADATPVVAACLASGTVRALALAFDCVEEAAEVDPEARGVLEALLDEGADRNPDRRRLVNGVKAHRMLREVITLGDGAALCARPVPRALYELFARDEPGVCLPGDAAGEGPADAPAGGLWVGTAARFAPWLNGLSDDGTAYRMPTAEEVADPAVGLVADLSRHTVWTGGPPALGLHRPEGAPWPCVLRPEDWPSRIGADRRRVSHWLRLALMDETEMTRVVDFGGVLAAAFGEALEFRGDPEHHPLRRLLQQAWLRDLGLAQLIADAGGAQSAEELRTQAVLARARVRALRALLASHDATPATPRMPSRFDGERITVQALLDARDLVEAPVDDLRRHLRAMGRPPVFGTPERLLAEDLDQPLRAALEAADAHGTQDPRLTRDINLAVHIALTRRWEELAMSVTAFRTLVAQWAAPAVQGVRAPARRFDIFLAGALPTPHRDGPVGENPVLPLRRAREALRYEAEATSTTEYLMTQALSLTAPMLAGEEPYDEQTLACVRIALLAAVVELRRHPAVEPLTEALLGLTYLQQRVDGGRPGNELLLLIRC
ncbi:NACHT domain-containing protein [Streptomyces capparidis]